MLLQRLFSKSKKEKTLDKIDNKTSKSLKVGGSMAAGKAHARKKNKEDDNKTAKISK